MTVLDAAAVVLIRYANDFDVCDAWLYEKLRALSDGVLRLTKRQSKSHRVRADALALAALAFGLRSMSRAARLRRLPFVLPKRSQTRKLLKKLEVFRKRGKRLWLRETSAGDYESWRKRWLCFTAAVRRHNRMVSRPRPMKAFREERESIFRFVLFNAKKLLAEKKKVYDEKDLPAIVRKGLRRIRRERAGSVTVKDVLVLNQDGRDFLSNFLDREFGSLFWKRKALEPDPLAFLHLYDDEDEEDDDPASGAASPDRPSPVS